MTKKNIKSSFSKDGKRYNLRSPNMIKKADAFLWNNRTLNHVTAHGFSQSQFMQPEPSFYGHAPLKSEKAAMAPEPQYFDHHPGRFFYVKDKTTGEYFSAPFRPTNKKLDEFEFSPGLSDIKWLAKKNDIRVDIQFALPKGNDVVELWKVIITNTSKDRKNISLYPFFPVGFPSWMNTEGEYCKEIEGMLAYTLTPYRKMEDYFWIKELNDYTYLVADRQPDAWEASLSVFEGEGGLRTPEGLDLERLTNTEAAYETAACIMQFDFLLAPGESITTNLIYGPATND